MMRYFLLHGGLVLTRVDEEGNAEIKKKSGEWIPYDDLWEIDTNGREVTEAEALAI